ncbi:MAG TPA: glycosyltransferase [Capillimicrobium sp.]|nr:glycosyltransferase [Capillimicrobium sp.]
MTTTTDPRTTPPTWDAQGSRGLTWKVRMLALVALPLGAFYLTWLAQPERIGHPVLFALLLAAELFNFVQAAGFWWTCSRQRCRTPLRLAGGGAPPEVDVLIPVYDEPVGVVEPTVAAAARLRGARVNVWLLDDGASTEMRRLADRHGARYVARAERGGAKAGNINHALRHARAPFVVVLDCDHVPDERLLEATLGHLADERVAFVQTPQYYANHGDGGVAAGSWAQQALFFGAIARGKDGLDATFCCGTNVVFRRAALDAVGGFPEGSLTEDFQLSIHLHELGWRTVYLPEVLARGLGPADMASYVSQQQRWARGCLTALPTALRARLPLRQRLQYVLSAMYFLSGWTVLVYMSMPVLRILTGAQPLGAATADQFLIHFAPYFGLALYAVAVAGGGAYTFRGFALAAASWWIHVQATILTLLRRRGRFVVTPKEGEARPQPRAVAPSLLAIAVLLATAALGVARGLDPATLNNVAFAALHVTVLSAGVWPALFPARTAEGAALEAAGGAEAAGERRAA